jgi:muramoyltetrapeptide carboxypeptidase LdcA involved in peptidoglycan recycling
MAINSMSGLSTLYGPAVIPSFGDAEGPPDETVISFLDQVAHGWSGEFTIPARWSTKGPGWADEVHGKEDRTWNANAGLICIQPGQANGPSLAANVNTLVGLAGTKYIPPPGGRIIFLEEMNCPLSRFERNLMQLKLMGFFDGINGIVLSKPEIYDNEGAPFDEASLLVEILDNKKIPVIGRFDNGHTHPMLSVPQGIEFCINASNLKCSIRQMESFTAQQGGADGARDL